MRNPILAAVLSLIVAGLGQIYNGQVLKGVVFIILQLINGALTLVLIGWILMPIVGLWAVVARYESARAVLPSRAGSGRRRAARIGPNLEKGGVARAAPPES